MIIKMTQKDISTASQGCCTSCPFARAIERTTGVTVWVSRTHIGTSLSVVASPYGRTDGRTVLLSKPAQRFIKNWDGDSMYGSPANYRIEGLKELVALIKAEQVAA